MQPIFKEQIQMWHDCGGAPPIKEGIYWINNQVVKAFELGTGKLCNLYRMKVNDDLSISYKDHKDFNKHRNKVFETWHETIIRMSGRLNEIEESSVSVVKAAMQTYTDCEKIILTSTGKDSMVVEHICNLAGFNSRSVFNNTSLDVADTYRLAKVRGYEITSPDEGFYQYIKRLNYIPTRMSRGCCTVFKEGCYVQQYKNIPKQLIAMGMRNQESAARSGYGDIYHNPKWPGGWTGVLPIREWTDVDVWLYTLSRSLAINPKYRKGYQRVGCAIACPYYTKTTWALDKYWYPKAYARWHKILDNDFVQGEKWVNLNCTQEEYHQCWNGGLLRAEPTSEVIEEFMKHRGLDSTETAMQYFNKRCSVCMGKAATKNIRDKDTLGMNLKMFGRATEDFLCKKHLMEKFAWTEENWGNQIADFKAQGCKLF